MQRTWFNRARRALTELFGGTSDFSGADSNRLLADWTPSRKAADDEIRWNATKLRSRARHMERNNALIKHFLRLTTANVIGDRGAHLQVKVRNNDEQLNKRINDAIEAAFCKWGRRVSLDNRFDWVSFQNLVLRGVVRDGEAMVRQWRNPALNAFGYALEYIDPDLVDETYNRSAGDDGNEVVMGVEMDSLMRPVAYHVWDRPASSYMARPRVRQRIPASEIIHLYVPERAGQTRAVTWLASVMVPAQMLDKYIEAELVGARMAASKMGFFQKTGDGGGAYSDQQNGSFEMEMNPGTFGILPDGYTLGTFDPNHPNGAFADFCKGSTRRIATGLGVSYNILASDLEGVNYSSMRSGMLSERDVWRTIQAWWETNFLCVVYEEWLKMSLLVGALKFDSRDPNRFMEHKWTHRGWTWVDPLKDTQAGVLGVQNGLVSRTMLLAEQGLDFEDVLEQLAEEKRMADEAGISLVAPAPAANDKKDAADSEDDSGEEDAAPKKKKDNARTFRNRIEALMNGSNHE